MVEHSKNLKSMLITIRRNLESDACNVDAALSATNIAEEV
jgi:hypothetical protein